MNRFPLPTRRTMMFASCSLFVLSIVVALSINLRTRSQQPTVPSQPSKDHLLRFVENSPELPLRVAGNENCPFRITQATVKQISGPDFSKLTARTTDLPVVSSIPQVSVINTSSQTVTGFVLVVRNPEVRFSRGFVQQKVSIAPGETYLIKREHFVGPQQRTIARANEPTRQVFSRPGFDSEDFWLQFGSSELFVTIGKVNFLDGTSWMIQEGGEVK